MTTKSMTLASGRTVVAMDDPERLELRAPDGSLELEIDLTGGVARVRVTAADLDLRATRRLSLSAPDIAVCATERLSMQATEEVSVSCEEDVRVTGRLIHLN